MPAEPGDLHARPRHRAERAGRSRSTSRGPTPSGRRSSRCHPRRCCRRAWAPRRSARTSRGSSAPARTTGRRTPRPGSSSCAATRTSRSGRRPPSRTATSTASCSASGSAPRPRSPQVERGQADWVVDDIPADRLPELLTPLRPAAARQPAARRLVLRAQRQHPAVRRARGAAGRQSRDRQERDREALRRAAASRRRPAR